MITLKDDTHWVAASEISEVQVQSEYDRVLVTLKNGTVHAVAPRYRGEGVYAAARQIVLDINNELALSNQKGNTPS